MKPVKFELTDKEVTSWAWIVFIDPRELFGWESLAGYRAVKCNLEKFGLVVKLRLFDQQNLGANPTDGEMVCGLWSTSS